MKTKLRFSGVALFAMLLLVGFACSKSDFRESTEQHQVSSLVKDYKLIREKQSQTLVSGFRSAQVSRAELKKIDQTIWSYDKFIDLDDGSIDVDGLMASLPSDTQNLAEIRTSLLVLNEYSKQLSKGLDSRSAMLEAVQSSQHLLGLQNKDFILSALATADLVIERGTDMSIGDTQAGRFRSYYYGSGSDSIASGDSIYHGDSISSVDSVSVESDLDRALRICEEDKDNEIDHLNCMTAIETVLGVCGSILSGPMAGAFVLTTATGLCANYAIERDSIMNQYYRCRKRAYERHGH